MDQNELSSIAKQVRIDIIRSLHKAGSGHPGGSLSAADILTALYFGVMDVDPADPWKKDRDKFVLSKGHACPALYSVLSEKGFFPKEELMTLRELGSRLQGHPNIGTPPGIEMTTGSLGQGLSVALGMALAAKLDGEKTRVFTLLGDGEIQEGMVWEAAMAAVHYELDNLIAIVDWNGMQIDGWNDEVMKIAPVEDKFRGFGWEAEICDGHDFGSILGALSKAGKTQGKPLAVIAKTVKGKGVSFMENKAEWHGKAPNDEQFEAAMKELGGEPDGRN